MRNLSGKLGIGLFFWLSAALTPSWGEQLLVPSVGYETIQSAIESANPGDEVIVAAGIYKENLNFRGKAITVRSEDPEDPNVVAATIIDGSAPADPNFGSVVVFNSGEGHDSVLTGFTITGGTGSWILVSWRYNGLYWNRCGGGVLCYNLSEPTIARNVFRDNSAGQGGGIYIYGDPVNPADPANPVVHVVPVITDNLLENNSALISHGFTPPNPDYAVHDHGDGGAIVGFQGCDAVIQRNIIRKNFAYLYGGGIHLRQWSDGLIANNQIYANKAELGAGVHLTYMASPTVRDNYIASNLASNLGGAGIYVILFSQPLIERNLIMQNESTNGAGIAIFTNSSAVIRDNLICRNLGSGIRIYGSNPTIHHNTITHNTGTGVDCYQDTAPVIENNIISFNEKGYGVTVYSGSGVVLRYNNVWNNEAGGYGPDISDRTGVEGNISVNPEYLDAESNEFHLHYSSRCINAGDPAYAPGEGEADYEGQGRKKGSSVDMGAYEANQVWNILQAEQYASIQEGVDDAENGDILIVVPGIHTGPGNRDIVYGGKAITLQSIDPQDPEIVEGTVIDCEGTLTEPHRGFHFYQGEEPNSILDGFTVTNAAWAYEGGAIRCSASSPTIRNCILVGNSAQDRGGGIYLGNGSEAIIHNCVFQSNRLEPAGYGGGIFCKHSSPTITNCYFLNNSAVGDGRHGGGICCFGSQDGHSNPVVTNCIFSGNSAGHRGGGLYAYWSSPTFINCTVIGNQALEGGGVGSFSRDYLPDVVANPTLINCIVRDNRAELGPEIALINTFRVWGWYEHTEMTISHSNIKGGRPGIFVDTDCILHWGEGNMEADPNFTDPGYWHENATPDDPNDDYYVIGNYHLTPGSACINTGDTDSLPAAILRDIDGEDRIIRETVDMGADEFFQPDVDINGDGRVDCLDLMILSNDWLEVGANLAGDLSTDGQVDLQDIAALGAWWCWQGFWRLD